ncbi:hypothetical protein P692DRAFT_201798535 [Suillus brevipes Sb2]|nr:hypothetical protein P692DRAFT_201798535 [Suillus brevipes Sb2]
MQYQFNSQSATETVLQSVTPAPTRLAVPGMARKSQSLIQHYARSVAYSCTSRRIFERDAE